MTGNFYATPRCSRRTIALKGSFGDIFRPTSHQTNAPQIIFNERDARTFCIQDFLAGLFNLMAKRVAASLSLRFNESVFKKFVVENY